MQVDTGIRAIFVKLYEQFEGSGLFWDTVYCHAYMCRD